LIASAGVSDDGCFVGFSTTIESLVPGQNPASLINTFRYDRMSNAIEQVNRNVEGLGANNAITTLGIFRMSPDGQWFVFHSPATNLTDEPTNGQSQIFLRWMAWREDCAGNGIPDECEPPGVDCNGNGMADACECGCAGDTNGDGQVDGRDLQTFVVCLTTGCSPTGCFCSDLSGDGATAEADIPLFVDVLLSAGGSNCP
jgi:hypothetical protein